MRLSRRYAFSFTCMNGKTIFLARAAGTSVCCCCTHTNARVRKFISLSTHGDRISTTAYLLSKSTLFVQFFVCLNAQRCFFQTTIQHTKSTHHKKKCILHWSSGDIIAFRSPPYKCLYILANWYTQVNHTHFA